MSPREVVDNDLQVWELTSPATAGGFDQERITVAGEGLRGGTVCLNTGDGLMEVPPGVAREVAQMLIAAADHSEAVGR